MRAALWVNAAWMTFVWGNRIRNAAADDGGQAGAYVLSAACLVGAAVLVVVALRGAGRAAAAVVAGAHAALWAVRSVQIALADHPLGFVLVHVALGVVSVALAAWLLRELRRTGDAPVRSPALWDSPSR